MLPNLRAIETRAGRIAVGAEVKSTRYPVQGIVTAIVWAGYFYAIQVGNRHSDDAAHYELLPKAREIAAAQAAATPTPNQLSK